MCFQIHHSISNLLLLLPKKINLTQHFNQQKNANVSTIYPEERDQLIVFDFWGSNILYFGVRNVKKLNQNKKSCDD